MDAANFDEIITCGICLEMFYGIIKCPRMLSCGHSFCHSCLEQLLIQRPSCPNCRTRINYGSVGLIPINISLKSLLNFRNNLPNLPSTLEALNMLCQDEAVYAVEDSYDGTRYGKVAVKDGRIRVHSFQPRKPNGRIFEFKEILLQFDGSTELPKVAFLQLSPRRGRSDPIEVVIETEGPTPRGKNFVLLCAALKGFSYRDAIMRCFRNNTGGGSLFYHVSPGPPTVIEGISYYDFRSPLQEAGVYGMWEQNSWFRIQVGGEPSSPSSPKFGVVIAGLQSLEGRRGECSVTECGLVI